MSLSRQLQKFIKIETASGLLLLFALMIALLIANSPLNHVYDTILDLPIRFHIGNFNLSKPFLLWINDGLMAIFFMLLALEMKREMLSGELSTPQKLASPVIAAVGGIVVPALIYLSFNRHGAGSVAGWPIATTTDIAFALGLIGLLGKRIHPNLKVFLVALSIVDDILAITIIAIFYTDRLSFFSFLLACLGLIILIVMNRFGVKRNAAYIMVGIVIWVCVLKSGIHATLAGVLVGLTIPLEVKGANYSPLRRLEQTLHPWVGFMILPLFVFANGGISFADFKFSSLLNPVPLGIILGLFVGKSCGVFLFSFVAEKLKLAQRPEHTSWAHLFGLAALTGVGFTMSLFLASLAFHQTVFEDISRQGVLVGSLLSGLLATGMFLLFSQKHPGRKVNR